MFTDTFTPKDWGMIALATAVPCGYSYACYLYYKDSEEIKWFESLKKPSWFQMTCARQAVAQGALLSCVCVGGYLAYKHSEGFTTANSKLALVSLSTFGVFHVFVRLFAVQQRCIPLLAGLVTAGASIASVMAYSFYKIYPLSGYLICPLVAFMLSGSVALVTMAIENGKCSKPE